MCMDRGLNIRHPTYSLKGKFLTNKLLDKKNRLKLLWGLK